MFSKLFAPLAMSLALLSLVGMSGCAAHQLGMLYGGNHYSGLGGQPRAIVSASALSGQAPLSVVFDFSSSSCAVDYQLGHHWFDPGLGQFEEVGNSYSHMYTAPGTYLARLKVEDSQGSADYADVSIEVY